MSDPASMEKRKELTQLLEVAARAEHALCCSYLYAAFSFKRTHDEGGVTYQQLELMRRWEASMLMVSRQEMEHLGLVLNLRTAMGEAPSFDIPEFPFTEEFEGLSFTYALRPFSKGTMACFCLAEMPLELQKSSEEFHFLNQHIGGFNPGDEDMLARIYQRVRQLIAEIDEDVLFIGPPAVQFNTHDIFPGAIRGLDISKNPAYQVKIENIFNRQTALEAVGQIVTEGEGAHLHGKTGHFAIFFKIFKELVQELERDPGFAPARDVIDNPTLLEPHLPGQTPVTSDLARLALQLFECGYETMLLGLTRFFAFPQNDRSEMAALQQAMFFPMMTTIIRPLGEVLTMLPSGAIDSRGPRAGASFNKPDGFELSPHKSAAYKMLHMRYGQMENLSEQLRDDAKKLPPGPTRDVVLERLEFLYQQIFRSRMNLEVNYGKKPDEI